MMNPHKVNTRQLRSERFQGPNRAWRRLRHTLYQYELEGFLEYKQVLGHGGFGMVQKWHVNKNRRFQRSVAVKTIIKPEHKSSVEALKREIWWMKQFRGSKHLVQLVDLDPKIMYALDINREVGGGNLPIMVMEELGRGNLAVLLERMDFMKRANEMLPEAQRGMEYIPNRVLWNMFLCCSNPVLYWNGIPAKPIPGAGRNRRDPIVESMYDVPEGAPGRRIIHNDIDIYNVFVGNMEPSGGSSHKGRPGEKTEHLIQPIIKIADYGCMVEWDDNWDDDTKLHSVWGKSSFKAPEQFGKRPLIPGSMGIHTNVYQIGGVMHDLITQSHVDIDNRSRFPRVVLSGVAAFDTYGWRLLEEGDYNIDADWKNVDSELRELVAGCMARDPAWRPGLSQLEHLITHRIERLDSRAAEVENNPNPPPKSAAPDVSAPAPPLPEAMYRYRVPEGYPEPKDVIRKFRVEYFVDDWGNPDKYDAYWGTKTLTPET